MRTGLGRLSVLRAFQRPLRSLRSNINVSKTLAAASLSVVIFALELPMASCGSKKSVDVVTPKDLSNLPDTAKVAYMMQTVSPDSVARYICDASLGRYPQAQIDTFPVATAYAYQHYTDTCLIAFSQELDYYSANLPLPDKMRIYSMGGQSNPQGLGYEMGLEYVSYIRENKMSVEDVKREINAFKEACGEDSLTYIRFIKGFKTVLNADRGKDLPEQIYTVFIDY